MMRSTLAAVCVTAIALTGVAAPAPAAETYTLKQTLTVGDQTDVRHTHDLRLDATFTSGTEKQSFSTGAATEAEYKLEVLAVGTGGAVRLSRATFRQARRQVRDGGAQRTEKLPWQGKSVTLVSLADQTQALLSGVEPDPLQMAVFRHAAARMRSGGLLPETPKALGEVWVIRKSPTLSYLLRLTPKADVQAAATLVRIAKSDGHRCAEIGLKVQADQRVEGGKTHYDLQGRAWFSLDAKKIIRVELEGDVKADHALSEPALGDRVVVKGRLKVVERRGWQPVEPPDTQPEPEPTAVVTDAQRKARLAVLQGHWQSMLGYLKPHPITLEARRKFVEGFLAFQPTHADLAALFGEAAAKAFVPKVEEVFNVQTFVHVGEAIEKRSLVSATAEPFDTAKFRSAQFVKPVELFAVVLRPATGKGKVLGAFVYVNNRWVLIGG